MDEEEAFVRYLRSEHPELADLPLFNDEGDPEKSWWKRREWRGGSGYAARYCTYIGTVVFEIPFPKEVSINSCFLSFGGLDSKIENHWGPSKIFAIFQPLVKLIRFPRNKKNSKYFRFFSYQGVGPRR